MRNRKGNGELIAVLVIVMISVLVLIGLFALISLSLNSGSSVDTAYGVESNTFWYKLYLKDDHKTIYCIDKDDTSFITMAQNAARDKEKVKVTYQEYIFRGSLCGGSETYDAVVVTNLEVLNDS